MLSESQWVSEPAKVSVRVLPLLHSKRVGHESFASALPLIFVYLVLSNRRYMSIVPSRKGCVYTLAATQKWRVTVKVASERDNKRGEGERCVYSIHIYQTIIIHLSICNLYIHNHVERDSVQIWTLRSPVHILCRTPQS